MKKSPEVFGDAPPGPITRMLTSPVAE